MNQRWKHIHTHHSKQHTNTTIRQKFGSTHKPSTSTHTLTTCLSHKHLTTSFIQTQKTNLKKKTVYHHKLRQQVEDDRYVGERQNVGQRQGDIRSQIWLLSTVANQEERQVLQAALKVVNKYSQYHNTKEQKQTKIKRLPSCHSIKNILPDRQDNIKQNNQPSTNKSLHSTKTIQSYTNLSNTIDKHHNVPYFYGMK